MNHESKADGYNFSKIDQTDDSWESSVYALWYEYLVGLLGWKADDAERRIKDEISGALHEDLIDGLAKKCWRFEDRTVLDIGCGTGALLQQLSKTGASVLGLEPSKSWGRAANLRVKALPNSNNVHIITGQGHRLPLGTDSIDFVISLQVLEHVTPENRVDFLKEIKRVLKYKGRVLLRFENYLSAWEPHYRVRWLPYLPKSLGSLYLKAVGRDPWFLKNHIHYLTGIRVAILCHQYDLVSEDWKKLRYKVKHPELFARPWTKLLGRLFGILPDNIAAAILVIYLERSKIFRIAYSLELENADCRSRCN